MIMIIDPNDTITGDNDQNPSETGSFLSKMFRAGVSVVRVMFPSSNLGILWQANGGSQQILV